MMRAIHVNWTKPYFERHRLRGHGFEITRQLNSKEYDQPDYQILYTILSAWHWRKNGPIDLYTDTVGYNFYEELGLLDLYDNVNINFLDGYSKTNIDPAYFWTSGKIKVLANQTKPFVFLDQDMIIRDRLPQSLFKKDITVTHWEIPRGYYYFDKEKWEKEIKHIDFPKNYEWRDWSPNTSFLYFNNLNLLKEYHDWHKKLVNNKGNKVPEWFWLLTDQGILGHIIREGNYKTETLTDKIYLADSNYGTPETRHKGQAENWYYPIKGANKEKDNIDWYHVWIDKIHFYTNPKYKNSQTLGFFDEIIKINQSKFLSHPRFEKYWKQHENS